MSVVEGEREIGKSSNCFRKKLKKQVSNYISRKININRMMTRNDETRGLITGGKRGQKEFKKNSELKKMRGCYLLYEKN